MSDDDFESRVAEPPRGFREARLTPRQVFTWIAVVLGVTLVALLIYILFFMNTSQGIITRGGADASGLRPLLVIDGPGSGRFPRFSRPMGVAFGLNGMIYVADTGNNRVCVFDSGGSFMFEFGTFGPVKPRRGVRGPWRPGMLNYPVGIDVDSDGTVYVADFRNDQIQAFSSDGEPLRAFPDPRKPTGRGSSGQAGQGIAVTDVAVRSGKVYATDTYQVLVFDLEGKLLLQFGKPGSGPGDLDHPNGVTADDDGSIYVSDSNHARVTAFGPDGAWRWNLGAIPGGSAEASGSRLSLPRGLTKTDDGSIIVVDAFGFDLVRISADGRLLGRYGERGVQPGQLNFPNDVDDSGSRLLVADKENNRVQVVRLVGR